MLNLAPACIKKMFIVFDGNGCSSWEADSEANQK